MFQASRSTSEMDRTVRTSYPSSLCAGGGGPPCAARLPPPPNQLTRQSATPLRRAREQKRMEDEEEAEEEEGEQKRPPDRALESSPIPGAMAATTDDADGSIDRLRPQGNSSRFAETVSISAQTGRIFKGESFHSRARASAGTTAGAELARRQRERPLRRCWPACEQHPPELGHRGRRCDENTATTLVAAITSRERNEEVGSEREREQAKGAAGWGRNRTTTRG